MEKSFQTRVSVVLLAFFTLAAIVFACINLSLETKEQTPIDGVTWFEGDGGLRGPPRAARRSWAARRHRGRRHPRRSQRPPHETRRQPQPRDVPHQALRNSDLYDRARGYRFEVPVILDAADRSLNQGFRLIALVYLGIGLYVLFRRWTAPRSTHFYLFCLASFVLYSFKYTDRLTDFDWVIYWGNVVGDRPAAGALSPLRARAFPLESTEDRRIDGIRRWLIALTYLPAVIIVGLRVVAINFWSATALLDDRLNKFAYAYLATCWVLASVVFYISYLRTDLPLRRQQLKWLTRGTILAIAPFTLLYIVPYLADVPVPGIFEKLAGISLVILPLTFSWAIIRYRLMDVDLIFKRGVTYTLATATVVGLYFLLISIAGEIVHKRLPAFGSCGLITAIILAALLFDPLKRAIQERIDKLFDRKRYDYRQTLIEFGRGLSSQTDLDALLTAIVDRLSQTLSGCPGRGLPIRRPRRLHPGRCSWLAAALRSTRKTVTLPDLELGYDLGFLDFDQPGAGSHIFLENTQHALHLPEAQQRTVAALDLELLPALPPAAAHHRRHRPGTHHRRRLPLQRRRGAARIPRQLHRHRSPECAPLRQPPTEGL